MKLLTNTNQEIKVTFEQASDYNIRIYYDNIYITTLHQDGDVNREYISPEDQRKLLKKGVNLIKSRIRDVSLSSPGSFMP